MRTLLFLAAVAAVAGFLAWRLRSRDSTAAMLLTLIAAAAVVGAIGAFFDWF